jgi:hypothetical protein
MVMIFLAHKFATSDPFMLLTINHIIKQKIKTPKLDVTYNPYFPIKSIDRSDLPRTVQVSQKAQKGTYNCWMATTCVPIYRRKRWLLFIHWSVRPSHLRKFTQKISRRNSLIEEN